jgi:hypothetical protein
MLFSREVRARLESFGRLIEGDDCLDEAALVRDGGRDLLPIDDEPHVDVGERIRRTSG